MQLIVLLATKALRQMYSFIKIIHYTNVSQSGADVHIWFHATNVLLFDTLLQEKQDPVKAFT